MLNRLNEVRSFNYSGPIDLTTDDCERFVHIDIENNIITEQRVLVLGCGCCAEYEFFDLTLEEATEYFTDVDFNELINELRTNTNL